MLQTSFMASATPGNRTMPFRPFCVDVVTMACSKRRASVYEVKLGGDMKVKECFLASSFSGSSIPQ